MNDILLQDAYHRHQAGDLGEAARLYREILAADPKHADALSLLGLVRAQQDEIAEANRLADAALAIPSRSVATLSNLGWLLQNLGRCEDALVCYDRLLAVSPRQPDALFQRGNMLLRLRRHRDALACFDIYVSANPGNAEAWISHGAALFGLNALDGALESFAKARVLAPSHTAALSSHAGVLVLLNRPEEAIADYHALLAIDPDFPYAHGNLLQCLLACCDWRDLEREKAIVAAGLEAGNRIVSPFQNVAFCTSPEQQLRAARVWLANDGPRGLPPLSDGRVHGRERIRVAYLSEDFRNHAVAMLMAGVWECHDRSRFETIALSFGLDDRSALRARAEKAFDRFIDVRHKSDEEIARLIRDLDVDIAVDLMGYSGHCRPGILAHRPAPIQVNHLGFPGTMGADHMDYIIADRMVVPNADRIHYSENAVYLPGSYMPADSGRPIAARTPSRAEAGLPETGFVFCCFNSNSKFAPEMFALWMRLLGRIPGSVLWLSAPSNAAAKRNLGAATAASGIAPERIVFAPYAATVEDHLARLRLGDLFLDTLPYNAHTTACDALWAGLPVLTVPGHTFAGRVAASLLNALGLPEMIAPSLEDYETLALHLARDPVALSAIRAKLARQRATAPLFDTQRYTRDLEAVYSEMYRLRQRGEPARSFSVSP